MSEIVIYEAENQIQVAVEFDGNTVWLNLNQLSILFGRDKSVISRHLTKVFKSNELDKDTVVAKNATTASDGKIYQVDYYNLDAILSVGYRVNSKQGTLKNSLIKCVLNLTRIFLAKKKIKAFKVR